MTFSRRGFLHLAAGTAVLSTTSRFAGAQTYPTRPVTLIVFVGAGGAPDIKARFIAQSLSKRLGQSIVVENRPGAGGYLSLQAVARAQPDGYTLLLAGTPHAVNATFYKQLSIVRDIVPVARFNSDAFVMVVTPSLPAKTPAEFVAHAKANPGKINMTSSGTGNLSHLAGEMFKMMTGIDVVHVPYKGTVAALAGLMAGEVHVMFDAIPSAFPHIQSGKVRALGVTSTGRVAALPTVPPISEFVPGYEVIGVLGIGAPKGTPPAIVDRLNREVNAVLADPEVKARLGGFGSEVLSGSPAEFGKLLAAEAEKWAKVVRVAGLKPR